MSQNSFLNLNYLSNCDLINKYSIKNIHSIPKVNKTILNFSLNDFLSFSYTEDFFEKKDLNLKHRTFIFLFLLCSNIPFLKIQNANISYIKNNNSLQIEKIFFLLIFSNKKLIDNFLFELFIENTGDLKKSEFYNFSHKNNILKMQIKIPISNLIEANYLLNSNILSANPKEIYVDLCFFFYCNKYFKAKKYLIQNMPFFNKKF